MGDALPNGVGLGWRRETAWAVERRASLAFTEVVAESVPVEGPLPPALARLLDRGVVIIPHGVSLSLGSGVAPSNERLDRLARVVERLDAPFVSEHVAFVRGGGYETEHLLPVRRDAESLDVVVDNVRRATEALDVPLVLENIAHLFEWPRERSIGGAMDEATFLRALIDRTGCGLLLDVSNLHANAVNFGWDAAAFLGGFERDDIAYVHAAGGRLQHGFFHDTHAHPIGAGALGLLEQLVARVGPLPVLLERDDGFGSREALYEELDAIEKIVWAGERRRAVG